jgi:Kdo2-lipid IVA lauroyltransferase/acyltransferase
MKNKNRPLKKLKNDLIYFFILVLVFIVRAAPRSWSLFLARRLASAAYFLFSGERKKIERNLILAFGNRFSPQDRKRLGRNVFRNLTENLVDSVLIRRILRNDLDGAMQIEGLEHAKRAAEKKKGIIFLTAHTGCFEMLSARVSLLGFPLSVLGARIYDPRINDLIVENRTGFNVNYIERGEDLRSLIRALRAGGSFGVLCDLDTRVESRFIDFFGHPAKTPAGPFKLGVKFDVPLIPAFAVRKPDGRQGVVIHPEIRPEGAGLEEKMIFAMRKYNEILEKLIEQDPAQWMWMHDRWKSKP